MSESDNSQVTAISKAGTLEEIADFWDTHSLADYWDQTSEVDFEVRARRRHRITVDPDVYAQVEVQARNRGILPETLVNIWLAERLQEAKMQDTQA
jgi:hypothetical protein